MTPNLDTMTSQERWEAELAAKGDPAGKCTRCPKPVSFGWRTCEACRTKCRERARVKRSQR